MKNAIVVALFTLTAFSAQAADQVVTVTFESVANTPTKSGEKLDPSLFSFGPAVTGGEDDESKASSSGFGKPKDESCRWALLASFMKFQNKAKAMKKRVVGVRTYAGATESAKGDACVCLAGGVVVRSTIKATYK